MAGFTEAVVDCELVDTALFFLISTMTHLPGDLFDHSQLLFQCKKFAAIPKSSFRFQSMWVHHHTFLDQVRMSWVVRTMEFNMLNLQMKLTAVKRRLQCWNIYIFGDLFHMVRFAYDTVSRAKAAYLANPFLVLLMELN
ncbi:hypothetical protein ACS0TY_026995 [Phlomoides rotata]